LNKEAWIECNANCDGGDECKNRNIKKSEYKKVKVGNTNGKGEGLFAMEDIKKGKYIIEYVGKIKYKANESIYKMKYTDMDLWIDAKKGKYVEIHQSRMQSELCSRTMVHKRHAPHVLFCMQRHQQWNGVDIQLQMDIGRKG
jgi:hypothetical protein